MCPPESIPSAVELNEYSTDETVFESLMQLKSGCSIPPNVLSDVDPYQFTPSNLPAGMWYFWSGSKMDTENGFWRSTGEDCEIISSLMTCLRKTLQFYEGPASDGQKTNLMMQEYSTTDNYGSKLLDNMQDSRALYKVFLIDGTTSGSGRLSQSELLVKNLDDAGGPSAMADQSPDQPSAMADQSPDKPPAVENRSPDQFLGEHVLRGDYLEMDDLAIPLSRTTSADSSCMTRSITSEDFFDSDALLRELRDDNVDHDSRIKLNLSESANLKEVVMQPTTLGSLDKESKPCTGQTSKTNPTPESKPGDRCKNCTLNEVDSSSSSSSSSKEERKETKKRKMMKFICFFAF